MDIQDRIENYLLGRLTETEKADFEKELQDNPELKDKVELERSIVEQIKQRAFVNEQITLAKAIMEKAKVKKAKRGKIIKMITYPLAAAAVLAGVFFIHIKWQNSQCEELFSSNFEVYPNDLLKTNYPASYGKSVKGSSFIALDAYHNEKYTKEKKNLSPLAGSELRKEKTVIDSTIIVAMNTYDNGNYAEAEKQLSLILSSHKGNADLKFYLAVAELANGKTEDAIHSLYQLYTQSTNFKYYEEVRWYLALGKLKNHKKTVAKKYLKELVKYNGTYSDKANDLIQRLHWK